MTFHKNKSALHPVSTSDLKNVVITSTIHIKDTSRLSVAIFSLCSNFSDCVQTIHHLEVYCTNFKIADTFWPHPVFFQSLTIQIWQMFYVKVRVRDTAVTFE